MYFLTTRPGWEVTKIYDHYTFKQDRFKRDFAVMNQNTRKSAKTKVEKDFYKLLNNSNFGNDRRNNIGNCKLELMFDGLDEIAYIKKYTNIMSYIKKYTNIMLDIRYREFFSLNLLCQQAETEFKNRKEKLDKNNSFYNCILEVIGKKRDEDLEAIECYEKKKKRESFQCKLLIQSKIKSKVVKI